jgi:hypothetical protein
MVPALSVFPPDSEAGTVIQGKASAKKASAKKASAK